MSVYNHTHTYIMIKWNEKNNLKIKMLNLPPALNTPPSLNITFTIKHVINIYKRSRIRIKFVPFVRLMCQRPRKDWKYCRCQTQNVKSTIEIPSVECRHYWRLGKFRTISGLPGLTLFKGKMETYMNCDVVTRGYSRTAVSRADVAVK